MALDPLKFQVAIQDDATRELTKIEQEFEKLKDKTINVKVEGLQDLRNLLSALQHKQVETLGKDVASGLHEAAKGLQEEAQKAVRASLSSLAQDLATVKSAIQNDNFSAFSTRILKCAEAVNTLDEAFKKFHITIGSDEGMKSFMTGLGEVIRNVRTTMVQLNGIRSGGMNTITEIGINKANLKNIDDWAESVRKASLEATKLETEIRRLQDLESRAKLNGIDTSHITAKIVELQNNLKTLRSIENSASVSNPSRLSNEEAAAIKRAAQEKEKAVGSTRQLTSEEQRLAQALNYTTECARGQSQVLGDLKSMATQYLGVWGGQQFLHNIIEIGGQLEMQRLSIGAILGDMAKANDLFGRIKDLAVKSPFGVVELDSMTKQLSAYGFEYKELFDMTKRLADISAATGTDVGRLALALGHVRSEAALSGYTLRQFSMANIPLAKKLSEQLSEVEGKLVSVADVRKRVRNKEIGYDEVLDVIKDLTNEGGMFYNAQEVMSESVKAKFKNLKDAMDIMYGEIAESSFVGGGLKDVAAMLTSLTRHWQELGAVLLTVGGYWTIQKVSMMACNKVATEGNLVMGRFTAKQLEMQATTGNLSRKLLLQAVATKKLSVAEAEAAGAALGLSRAQLQHVANTGKIVSATNMASLATSKYTVSQLRLMATYRNASWLSWGKWLSGIKLGLAGAVGGVKSLTFAVGGLVRSFLPLLAVSAVVEIFTSMSRKAEEFAEAANYAGQSARSMMKDIDEAINSATTGGKPTDVTALRESVKTMKDVLEQNEFYTDEQQKQVDAATTLSAKYDILLKQLREMREEASWQADSEDLIKDLLEATSHGVITAQSPEFGETKSFDLFGIGNNSLSENIAEVTKANGELSTAISMLSEYQGVMQEAIEKNNGFGLSLDGKSWQEQIRLIAESGNWEKFISSVEHAGNNFEDKAKNVEKASKKVRDSWYQIANDDAEAIRLSLMKRFNMTEEGVMEFAKNNQKWIKWMVDGITKSLKIADVNIAEGLKQLLYNFFGISGGKKAEMRTPTEYDQQTDLGRRIVGNVIKYNQKNGKGGNGHITVKEANELAGTIENPKTESEAVKAIKERAQKDLQAMRDTEKIYGKTSNEYQAAKKKYERSLNIAKANRITEEEIDTKKSKKRSGSKTYKDEYAKRWDERIRIMKEAYGWYDKWEKKVGKEEAINKVVSEYGDIFKEWKTDKLLPMDFDVNNIEDFLEYVVKIRDEALARYSKQKNDKSQNNGEEAQRVFRQATDLLKEFGWDTFGRAAEKFKSEMDLALSDLQRKWDMFNEVRNATGSREIAANILGMDDADRSMRNLADATRSMIESNLASMGDAVKVPVAFDINMSDKQIEENVKNALGGTEYEERIDGIVEALKKWRELQRNVIKDDISSYAKLIGSAVDYESQLKKINDDLEKAKTGNANLVKAGNISQEDANKANKMAETQAEDKRWKMSVQYLTLMSSSLAMTKSELESGVNAAVAHLQEMLQQNLITTKEFVDEMEKLRNLQTSWDKNALFGKNTEFAAFLQGGIGGVSNWLNTAINKRMTELGKDYTTDENGRYNGNDEDMIKLLGKKEKWDALQKGLSGVSVVSQAVMGAFDGLQQATQSLSQMFDALGNEGAANFWSDVSDTIGGISSIFAPISNMIQSAMSGNVGGLVSSAITAPVSMVTSPITAFSQLHDKKIERQIEKLREGVQKIENNTSLIAQARERTLGYDMGDVRRSYAQQYAPDAGIKNAFSNNKFLRKTMFGQGFMSTAQKDMYEYYSKNSAGTGYQQEYQNLLQQREDYMKILDKQESKKKKSQSDIEETKKKISELDDQIRNFGEDLAKELWSIDIKGWADQFTDAMMSAFENGENMMDAFNDTAKSIMQSVVKEMLKIGIIEPYIDNLRKTLFGYTDDKGTVHKGAVTTEEIMSNPASAINKIVAEMGEWMKPGGAGSNMAVMLQEGLVSISRLMEQMGYTGGLMNEDTSNTLTASVQGTSEETSNLLAAYLNAARQDIAVNRILFTQFVTQLWPEYVEAFASHVRTVAHIDVNVQLMMEMMRDGNGALFNELSSLRSRFDSVVDGFESLSIR